jgi:hypothetical protein
MTRKDFTALAAALRSAYGVAESDNERRGVYESARRLAEVLRDTNPRFDRDRFIAAAIPTLSPAILGR